MQTGVINLDTDRPIWNARGLMESPLKFTTDVHAQLVMAESSTSLKTDRIPFWHLEGLTLLNSPGNATTRISVLPGRAITTIGGRWLATLDAPITKSLVESWAEGNNAGGRFQNVLVGNGTYHCFLIYDPATQKVDVGFDNNADATNRPAGWVARRIGSFLRSGTEIEPFTQTGNYFERGVVSPDFSAQIPTAGALYSLRVPSGVNVIAHGVLAPGFSAVNTPLAIIAQSPNKSAPSINALAPIFINFNATTGSYYAFNSGNGDDAFALTGVAVAIPTDTSARIFLRRSGTYNPNVIYNSSFQTFGWTDFNLLRGL